MMDDMPGDGRVLLVAPETPEADAGETVILHFTWLPEDGPGTGAARLRLLDPEGAEVARVDLAPGAEGSRTAEVALATRPEAGSTRYRAEVIGEGDGPPLAAAGFEVVTRAHATRLVAWDMPGTATAGTSFTVHIGLACASGCDLGGQEIRITDPAGRLAGSGRTAEGHWPGTAALHVARIAVTAPPETGLCRFTVTSAAQAGPPPHAEGTAGFAVNIMPEGSCDLAIELLSAESGAPLARAQVVLHPYRAETDADGMARLRVVPGDYRLQLSARNHMAASEVLTITGDLALRRMLVAAPAMRRPEDDY